MSMDNRLARLLLLDTDSFGICSTQIETCFVCEQPHLLSFLYNIKSSSHLYHLSGTTSRDDITRIAELVLRINENTFKVNEYIRPNGLPSPTFDEDGPVDFIIQSSELEEARLIAIEFDP